MSSPVVYKINVKGQLAPDFYLYNLKITLTNVKSGTFKLKLIEKDTNKEFTSGDLSINNKAAAISIKD